MDDGEGGDFELIYDGSDYASTYSFSIPSSIISCGTLYNFELVAVNSAGDSVPSMA